MACMGHIWVLDVPVSGFSPNGLWYSTVRHYSYSGLAMLAALPRILAEAASAEKEHKNGIHRAGR